MDWRANMAAALAAGGCTKSAEWGERFPGVHCWFDFKGIASCVLCGVCKAFDATKQKPCKGLTRIELRKEDSNGRP
jgi:hypothetical protein